jgi:uncharacterized protein YpmB
MPKFIVFILVIFASVALVNYLIFFWKNRKRQWRFEDEAFNEKKKKEAMKELKDSQELFEAYVPDYTKDYTKA